MSALLLAAPTAVSAADYIGAEAVLQKASEQPQSAKEENPSDVIQLKRDVESFRKQSAALSPEDAARQWLQLLDRQSQISPGRERQEFGDYGMAERFGQQIWEALPPPAAWDALRKAVDLRPESKDKPTRELALKLVAHTLVSDHQAQTNDLAHLVALVAGTSEDNSQEILLEEVVGQIRKALLENSNDPETVLKSLEDKLAAESSNSSFSVPNLVALVGEQKATEFFRHVFSTSTVIEVDEGEETKKLGRKLALDMIDQLKVPQWNLACSLDAGPLFEALEKKFASSDSKTNQPAATSTAMELLAEKRRIQNAQDRGHSDAKVFHLLTLISQNQTAEATAFAQKLSHDDSATLPADALRQLERAGYTHALHDFFYRLLSQNPDLPLWDDYISLSADVGETDKMLDLVRKAAAREDLSGKRRDSLRQNFYRALLAADHVDEAVAEMEQILAQPSKPVRGYDFDDASHGELAFTLAKIGNLLQRTNWTEEGIRIVTEEISPSRNKSLEAGYYTLPLRRSFVDFLTSIGRGTDAEKLLSEALADSMSHKDQEQSYDYGSGVPQYCLADLVSTYYHAGRYSDVVLLLDKAPGWGFGDLSGFHNVEVDNIHQHEDSMQDKLRYQAAASLLETGRKEEAAKIANAILDDNGGYDPAYEILAKIGGPAVMQRLDELFARDKFEERPLIWKAILLQQAGKLEEAEAAARRAISIDPSDGEQGPGRRMRAYAVLSDIRKARGDQKEADFFHNAVDAIRLSETADRYFEAGLLKQAVAMYEDSLMKFEGAYCIQSRLALRLSELGKHVEAAEHFQRAYELMPDSFGRVESHCFGCERAFQGEQAQSIADKVFNSLAKTQSQKPQVHYLLGYLREEQGKFPEALVHFQDAVKLDPDYLNAWKHVATVVREAHLPAADYDAVTFNVIRLDPLGRHGGWPSYSDVTDLRALWNAVEATKKYQPAIVTNLYALPASKAYLDQDSRKELQARFQMESEQVSSRHPTPARAVFENAIIAPAVQLIGGRSSLFD